MSIEISEDSKDPRPLAVAKLMLAVAWVDGSLQRDDVIKVQAYLEKEIRLNDEFRHSFNLYQEYAIEPMERRRLARRFARRFTTALDRKEVVKQLESLIPIEGENLNKTIAVQEIKEALVEDQINFMKKVHYKLTRTPFPAKISDLGREAYLQEYKANPILFRLKVRFGDSFRKLGLSQGKAEKLSLEMAMVGLVIYADQILLPEELNLLTEFLQKNWELEEKHNEMLITMALCRESSERQIPQFCKRFHEISSHEERRTLYLFLGEMARVDQHVTKSEQHILELIADGLDIPVGVRRTVIEQDSEAKAAIE